MSHGSSQAKPASTFVKLLMRRFGTGRAFTEAYLKYFQPSQAVALNSEQDWQSLDETRRMWFDYALSTNSRGLDLMQHIKPHKKIAGVRYLDIGCGFGGCLVAASRSRASACVGIELDALRASFARQNLSDFKLDVPVHDLDALTPGIEDQLGTFDLITCNDVAEHVESAEQLILNLGRLLRPGGMVYLQIPNGRCIDFVRSDGHFGLFGITLLERERAKAYHWERFHYTYDVGDYWTLEDYSRFFANAQLRSKLIDSQHHPTRPMSALGDQLRCLETTRRPDPALDSSYERYRAELECDRQALDELAFRNRYLRNFWTFIVMPGQDVERRSGFVSRLFGRLASR